MKQLLLKVGRDSEDLSCKEEVEAGSSRSRKRARQADGCGTTPVVRSSFFQKSCKAAATSSESSNPAKSVTLKIRGLPGRRAPDRVSAYFKEGSLGGTDGRKSMAAIMQTCLEQPSSSQKRLKGTFSSRLKEEQECSLMNVDVAPELSPNSSLDDAFSTTAGRGSRTDERTSLNLKPGASSDITIRVDASTSKPIVNKRMKNPPAGCMDDVAEAPRNGAPVRAALKRLHDAAKHKQIVHVEHLPGRQAEFGDVNFKMAPKLLKALKDKGIVKLYSHQAMAVNTIFSGSSIVASTPTASGKSMTYIIPVLDALINVPKSRAVFLFPLKALAHDQLKTLCELVNKVKRGQPHCYCYDGDTSLEDRVKIRKNARVVLTNPDMLHYNLLPKHEYWKQFFANLKFIVLDEAHTYRGVFGSHVGCILRRLLRICRHYGAEPMFICCSATIGNPKEHVKQLTTLDVEAIHGAGAPSGEKHVVCWQPPGKKSPFKQSAKIAAILLQCGLQILIFVEARKVAEVICTAIQRKLVKKGRPDLVNKVDSYRAGYLADDRRALEKRLQDGDLQALVTTRALELGIDVGYLDATIHVGLPDTMCSLWQQVGRSGRRQAASLAVVVALHRPNDLFYFQNPQKLFAREVEKAYCNPGNLQLLQMHLRCAASELPLEGKDIEYFGDNYEESRDDLAIDGVLGSVSSMKGETMYIYRLGNNPSSQCPIRGTSMDCFQLVTQDGQVIEEMESKMAFRRLHRGAIYPHRRETYQIIRFDILTKRAVGAPCNVDYITEVLEKRSVQILDIVKSRSVGATNAHLGKLRVTEQIDSYVKLNLLKQEDCRVLETIDPLLPASTYDTVGFWCDIPEEVRQKLMVDGRHFMEALDAVAKLMRALLPSLTMSELIDVNTVAEMKFSGTENPQIFLYDAYPGGMGLTKQAFEEHLEEILTRALSVVETCDCKKGCPRCVQSNIVEGVAKDEHMKQASKTLLQGLLGTWMSPAPKCVPRNSQDEENQPLKKNRIASLLEDYSDFSGLNFQFSPNCAVNTSNANW